MFQDIQQLHLWSGFGDTDNYHPTSPWGGHGDSANSYTAGTKHLSYPVPGYHNARAEPGKVHTQQLFGFTHWGPADDAPPMAPPGSYGDSQDSWSAGVSGPPVWKHHATSEAKPVLPTTRRHYPIGF